MEGDDMNMQPQIRRSRAGYRGLLIASCAYAALSTTLAQAQETPPPERD